MKEKIEYSRIDNPSDNSKKTITVCTLTEEISYHTLKIDGKQYLSKDLIWKIIKKHVPSKKCCFKGYAKCNSQDKFDKTLGENLARLRAKTAYKLMMEKIYADISNKLNNILGSAVCSGNSCIRDANFYCGLELEGWKVNDYDRIYAKRLKNILHNRLRCLPNGDPVKDKTVGKKPVANSKKRKKSPMEDSVEGQTEAMNRVLANNTKNKKK